MQTATEIQEQAQQESKFWALIPKNEAVCVELERGGEGLAEIYMDLETCPTEFSFKMLVKKMYGGGRYRAVMRHQDTKQFISHMTFSVSGVPKSEGSEEKPAAQVGGLEQIAALMMQNQQASEARLMAMMEKMADKPAQPDTFELMERFAGILHKNGSTPAPQKNFFEQAAEFKQAAEVLGLGGGADVAAPDLMGLASTLGVPLLDLLKEHAGVDKLKVAAALKLQQQRAPQGKPAKVTTLAPVATAPAVDLPVGFDAMVGQLVGMAEAKHDPVEVAALVVQIAPDTEWLKTYLQRDDALAQFAQLVPAVNQHWDWFVDLANAALLALGVEQVVTDESGRAGNTDAAADTTAQPAPQPQAEHSGRRSRNASNASDHARPRAPRKTARGSASPGTGTDQ